MGIASKMRTTIVRLSQAECWPVGAIEGFLAFTTAQSSGFFMGVDVARVPCNQYFKAVLPARSLKNNLPFRIWNSRRQKP